MNIKRSSVTQVRPPTASVTSGGAERGQRLENGKNPKPEKGLKNAATPRRLVHAVLGAWFTGANELCRSLCCLLAHSARYKPSLPIVWHTCGQDTTDKMDSAKPEARRPPKRNFAIPSGRQDHLTCKQARPDLAGKHTLPKHAQTLHATFLARPVHRRRKPSLA